MSAQKIKCEATTGAGKACRNSASYGVTLKSGRQTALCATHLNSEWLRDNVVDHWWVQS